MNKWFCGMVAFVVSFGAMAGADAQGAAQLSATIGAASLAQYGGDFRPGPGWDRDIDVRCASRGYQYNLCQVDTGMGSRVRIVKQVSDTRCVEGRNWGWNRAGVWVNEGCEAIFRVQRRWAGGPGPAPGPGGPGAGPGGDWQPGPGWNRPIVLRCASSGYQYNMCQVDTGRGSSVRIQRQISKTRCEEGRNWGWNRAGIWVDGGCEAEFRIDRRWR